MDRQENIQDEFAADRRRMLEHDLKGRGINNPGILEVMRAVPRELFVPKSYFNQAYNDGPLPIGLGQTISQPYIVALMTERLKIGPGDNVLEIGTGSGYQTAVLAKLAETVYTIEKFQELSESAQQVLSQLGLNNIEFFIGDGSCGWPKDKLPDSGCFDRIIITAAVPSVPAPLLDQLAGNGKLIAPVGLSDIQQLILLTKRSGRFIEESICGCRFVRLIGQYSF